jgi:hypothetical protein
MHTQSNSTTEQVAPKIEFAEPSVFLPKGRIGVLSMLFRWTLWFLAMLFAGFVLRYVPESARDVVSGVISYSAWALIIITAIKRGHDMGYSAWGVIILLLLPFLLLLPGDKQPNQFGPVPTRKL